MRKKVRTRDLEPQFRDSPPSQIVVLRLSASVESQARTEVGFLILREAN
jgi:hypothetical protein